jgi:hypothetical protein
MELKDKLISWSNNKWERIKYTEINSPATQFLDWIIKEFLQDTYVFYNQATKDRFDNIKLAFATLSVSSALDALIALMTATLSICYLNEQGRIVVQAQEMGADSTFITVHEKNCYSIHYDYFSSQAIDRVEIQEYKRDYIEV